MNILEKEKNLLILPRSEPRTIQWRTTINTAASPLQELQYVRLFFGSIKTDLPYQCTETGLKYMYVETERSSNGEGKVVPVQTYEIIHEGVWPNGSMAP
jgi:hypothetical protein